MQQAASMLKWFFSDLSSTVGRRFSILYWLKMVFRQTHQKFHTHFSAKNSHFLLCNSCNSSRNSCFSLWNSCNSPKNSMFSFPNCCILSVNSLFSFWNSYNSLWNTHFSHQNFRFSLRNSCNSLRNTLFPFPDGRFFSWNWGLFNKLCQTGKLIDIPSLFKNNNKLCHNLLPA